MELRLQMTDKLNRLGQIILAIISCREHMTILELKKRMYPGI